MKTYDDAVQIVLQNMWDCDCHEHTEDEARDIVDALGTHGLLNVAFPPGTRTGDHDA